MAQNLDELTLKIEADASEANAALDGLITKLGELSKALTQVKGNTKINVTTRQVQSLSHSVDNSSRAATRFGSAFRKSFATLGDYTKNVAKFGLAVGKGMFIGTPTAMAKGMMALGKGAASAVSGFAKLVTGARSTKERFEDLITTVGSLVIKFTVLKRAFSTLWDATSKAMNFIETFHYFDRSFDKIGEDSVNSWAQAGYDSAEAYAKSFKDRALELTSKMSGFNIDSITGEATSTGQASLGLDPNMLLNYQAQFGQMANGLGMTSEAALQTSKALTMLGADWSALRNIGFEESYTKMASALAGQTRAVRSLGVDISMATLAQYAMNAGLTTSVSKLDGAAKAELRMIAILDQSRVAWGDMATTLNTPANQYRLLTQNVNTLARAIGNIFLPVVQKVLPYINGLVIALQRLFTWLAKFLGIKSTGGGATGGMSDAFADMADDGMEAADGTDAIADAADDANDALGNAADTAERLKNTILGFDELNVLNSPNESSTTGTGGSGKSGKGNTGSTGMNPGDMALLDNALSSLMDEYEAAWQKALDGLSNKAQEIADKIVAAFTSKDWKGLGELMAGGVEWALRKVYDFLNPEKMYPRLKAVADAITETVNSFVSAFPADLAGRTIGRFINDYVYFMNQLYDGVEWGNIGGKIAEAFLGLISTIQPYEMGRLLMQKFNAAVGILEGFLEGMQGQWDRVGKKVEQFILGAMSMINPEQIANVINLAVEGATDFLGGIGWENLGSEIATRLEKLIINVSPYKIAGLISMAFKSALQLAKGFLGEMKESWDDLGLRVGALLSASLKGIPTGDIEFVASESMYAVLNFLFEGINKFRKDGGFKDLAEKTAALINTTFADPGKWETLGNTLRELLKGSLEYLLKLEGLIHWTEIGQEVHKLVKRAIDDDELWDDLGSTLKAWCEGIVDFLKEALPQDVSEWEAFGKRIGELLGNIPWASIFGLVAKTIAEATVGIWKGLGSSTAGKIVKGMGAVIITWSLIGPFVKALGMALIGDKVIKHLAWHLSGALSASTTAGATKAAGTIAGNAGLGAFMTKFTAALKSGFSAAGTAATSALPAVLTAAGVVGLGAAFLGVCHKFAEGIDILHGGNGKLSESGEAWHDFTGQLALSGTITQEQKDNLDKIIESLETSGATTQEMGDAVSQALLDAGVSASEYDSAMNNTATVTSTTTGQLEEMNRHLGEFGEGVSETKGIVDMSVVPMKDAFGGIRDVLFDMRDQGVPGVVDGFFNLDSILTGIQTGSVPSAQSAFDAIVQALGGDSEAAQIFIDKMKEKFPEAAAITQQSSSDTSTAMSNAATSASSSASEMATNVSNSMSTLERTAGDSATRLRTKQIREMKQAHTEGSKEMQGLQKEASASTDQMEKDVSTNMESSKSSVSTNTGEMKAVSYENLKSQMADVQFFLSRIAFNFSNEWGIIARDMSSTGMHGLKAAIYNGMTETLNMIGDFIDGIVRKFDGLGNQLYNIGYEAIRELNSALSQHVTLPHIYKQGDDRYYYGDGGWFDIPYFSVDWYAKGGMFTKPTLAGFAEAGDEAALPLTNKSVMARIASAIVDASPTGMGSKDIVNGVQSGVYQAVVDAIQTGNSIGGNNPTVINVNIDGDKFTQYTIDRINMQTERNGVSPLLF